MAPNETGAINIGEAVRHGLELKAGEAVALVHEACVQLDAGRVARLPTSMDELSVSAEGLVIVPPTGEPQELHTAVAGLLAHLIGALNEAEPVAPALRSLPARLRAAGAEKPTIVRDLLSILRWHLPQDPKEVLQALLARTTLADTADEMPAWDEPVADISPHPDLDLALAASTTDSLTTDRSTTVSFTASPAPTVRPRQTLTWAFATAALVAISLSGYAGYRYLSWPGSASAPSSAGAEARPISRPRIRPADERGQPHPLALPVRGGAFSPSFTTGSPHALLFHAGRNTAGHLYSAILDDRGIPSNTTLLLDEPARNYHARLSPDGKWIAFDSDRDGPRGVYIADRLGARIARVNGDGYGAVPSWSPDMKSLAFIRAEPGRPRVWNLWIRTLATGTMARATHFQNGQVWGASWFPDSESYAYSHEEELVIADRSGRQLATYLSPVPRRIVRTPAVSPDGRQVVFQVYREGVWLLDLASGAMHGLLDDPSAEEFAWDPSGRRIAYHSRRDGEWRIWVLTL